MSPWSLWLPWEVLVCILFMDLKGQTWVNLVGKGAFTGSRVRQTLAATRWHWLLWNPVCCFENLPLTVVMPFSVFKERRTVEMWTMQAGVLLRRGMSGRCGASWREGLLFWRLGPGCRLCHRLLAHCSPLTPFRAHPVCMHLAEVTSPGDRKSQLAATRRARSGV